MKNTNPNIPPFFYVVNVEGAIFNDDRWLMIQRSKKEEYAGGVLSFVGGKVDNTTNQDNILENTLEREIFEEVGIRINRQMIYVNSSLFIADGVPVLDIVFLCQYKSGEPYCKSLDEVDMIYWMTIEEVIRNPKTPIWLKRNIEMADIVRKQLIQKLI